MEQKMELSRTKIWWARVEWWVEVK